MAGGFTPSLYGRRKEIRPDHVAIYIRWSTDDQTTGTTLEEQRDGCEHYVKSQGWSVREDLTFIDEGYSGGNLDRPGMRRLRELVAADEIDCVVVLKIDRLSRNIVDAVDLVLREWDERTYLKSARQPIDTTTDLGRMIFGILAMFADFERAQIKERTESGKMRRIGEGRLMHGRPVFGYSPHPSTKGHWVENPDEAPLVRRIFLLAANGHSIHRICRELNGDGIRTRSGREWSVPAVGWLLRNRTYLGEIEYGVTSLRTVAEVPRPAFAPGVLAGKRPKKSQKRVVNQAPKYRGPTNAAPPLIDHATFDLAQTRIRDHRWNLQTNGARAAGSPYLLVGVSRCSCGAPLVNKIEVGKSKNYPGKLYRYYICDAARHGKCSANSGYIVADDVEVAVAQAFQDLYAVSELRAAKFAPRIQETGDNQAMIAQSMRLAQDRLRQLDDEERKLQKDARAGTVPQDQVPWLRSGIVADRKEVLTQIQSLQIRQGELDIHLQALKGTLAALSVADRWESLEVWHRRQLLRMLLTDRIVIVRPKKTKDVTVDIPWAF